MNRSFVFAFGLAAMLLPAAALGATGHPAANAVKPKLHAAPHIVVAPADEYFGRMKMSILGITNSIRDTGMREGFDPAHAANYYNGLALTQDALQDWARKYPNDGWIPRRAYDLSHDFWMMHTPQGNAAAQRCRSLLFRQFPHNHWAVIARSETAARIAPVATQPAPVVPGKGQ